MYRSGAINKQTLREFDALTRPDKETRKRALAHAAMDAARVRESSQLSGELEAMIERLGADVVGASGGRMGKKSKGSSGKWRDPDDAPEITQEWIDSASLYRGKTLVRRGGKGFAALLTSMPNVGEDKDFARTQTDRRSSGADDGSS